MTKPKNHKDISTLEHTPGEDPDPGNVSKDPNITGGLKQGAPKFDADSNAQTNNKFESLQENHL